VILKYNTGKYQIKALAKMFRITRQTIGTGIYGANEKLEPSDLVFCDKIGD